MKELSNSRKKANIVYSLTCSLANLLAFLLFFPTWGVGRLFSQDSLTLDSTYPFVQYALNKIEVSSSDKNWQKFIAKMDSAMKGSRQLNIVHLGGSHVQADIYTGHVRKKLQGEKTKTARGLIFPYAIAKSNCPVDYKCEFSGNWAFCRSAKENCGRLGLAGYSAATKDSAFYIRFVFDSTRNNLPYFTRLKILHNDSAKRYNMWYADSAAMLKTQQHHGYTEILLKSRQQNIQLNFSRKDTDTTVFELYGILVENDEPGIVYHSAGVNGARVSSVLRCQDLIPNLKLIRPDLVILSLGTNDAHSANFTPEWLEANYDTLILRIRAEFPNAAIMITTPNMSYIKRRYPNKNVALAEKTMLKLSEKHACSLWNFYQIMGGSKSVPLWLKARLMKPDKIHFYSKGYMLKGELFYHALMKSYAEAQKQ